MQVAVLGVVSVFFAEVIDQACDLRIFQRFLGEKAHVQQQFAQLFRRVAEAAQQWDGSDPIRRIQRR